MKEKRIALDLGKDEVKGFNVRAVAIIRKGSKGGNNATVDFVPEMQSKDAMNGEVWSPYLGDKPLLTVVDGVRNIKELKTLMKELTTTSKQLEEVLKEFDKL